MCLTWAGEVRELPGWIGQTPVRKKRTGARSTRSWAEVRVEGNAQLCQPRTFRLDVISL